MYNRTINKAKDKVMNTLTINETHTANATELYRDLVIRATLGQVEEASVWYHEAQEVAQEVAHNLNASLEIGAGVVSAFSPRERWATNITKAVAFSLGHEVSGLKNNTKMANDVLAGGIDALNGLKTNAFARAIFGDTEAVVIDVWMMRAAQMLTDSPSQGQYLALTKAVQKVAGEFGLTPRTAQALIWIVARGSAR
jgi:hypothetical protein